MYFEINQDSYRISNINFNDISPLSKGDSLYVRCENIINYKNEIINDLGENFKFISGNNNSLVFIYDISSKSKSNFMLNDLTLSKNINEELIDFMAFEFRYKNINLKPTSKL